MFFRSRENGRIQGRTVSQWLKVLGTAKPEENPLALEQLVTGEEPRRFVFEVSVSYDLLQLKHGEIGVRRLALFADGKLVSLADRASNGNCILTWEAVYDPPGTHR